MWEKDFTLRFFIKLLQGTTNVLIYNCFHLHVFEKYFTWNEILQEGNQSNFWKLTSREVFRIILVWKLCEKVPVQRLFEKLFLGKLPGIWFWWSLDTVFWFHFEQVNNCWVTAAYTRVLLRAKSWSKSAIKTEQCSNCV